MAYISNRLTHWVGRSSKNQNEQYNIFKEILRTKLLLFGNPPWSLRKKYPTLRTKRFPIISFTDIPLSESELICDRYSKFGISFNKTYLANLHATPVGYMQTPWIQGNINFIIMALKALENELRKKGITQWYFKGFRPKKIKETADITSLIKLFMTLLFTTEDYFGEKQFKYNVAHTPYLRIKNKIFEDYSALYYEREWRINHTSLLKKEQKNNIIQKVVKGEIKNYLKLKEKYIENVIIPESFIPRFNRERKYIFYGYNKKDIPTIIAYEDLKYI